MVVEPRAGDKAASGCLSAYLGEQGAEDWVQLHRVLTEFEGYGRIVATFQRGRCVRVHADGIGTKPDN